MHALDGIWLIERCAEKLMHFHDRLGECTANPFLKIPLHDVRVNKYIAFAVAWKVENV